MSIIRALCGPSAGELVECARAKLSQASCDPLHKANCPLCFATTDHILTRTLRRGTGTVFHCEACDVGFLVAPKVDAKGLYDGVYRQHASHYADGRPTNPQEIFDAYSCYQAERVRAVADYVKPICSILEIGASAGQFLAHFNHVGRCAIELDSACCAFMEAMGIDTDSNFLRESKFAGDRFDIVCSFQTMEHVADPVAFLEDVRSVMAPGGVAFIEVPNLHEPLLDVWNIPEYVPFYFHSDHLWYFSAGTLKRLAVRAGFYSPEVRFTQDYTLLSHLHWLMNKGPQDTCHPGLGPVGFDGKDKEISGWLSERLADLNAEYVNKLTDAGKTSNLMLVLTT